MSGLFENSRLLLALIEALVACRYDQPDLRRSFVVTGGHIMRSATVRFGVAMVAGFTCLGTLALAQAPAPVLTVHKVKDNLYYVEGGGGNSSIIIGQNGVIVVDV